MSNTPVWMTVFAAGVVLGGLNFWALHLTVQKAVSSETPGRYFLLSLLARMAVLLPLFTRLAMENPLYLPVCLLGFALARTVVLRRTRPLKEALSAS